ncbi:MAG: radical SAM protein [Spirochaetes bacterium]|nr:radical SAM protein [Spirochaetota bacterium]
MIKFDKNREKASLNKKYWLRISNTCNNHCLFCHDINSRKNINFIPFDELIKKIKFAQNKGYTHLILSGGEASIHPDFIKIIKYAKKAGFNNIQTVTNGRMFFYKNFADEAVNAGLSEVTFSFHGHNPKIHDEITRVPGSFNQAMEGLLNLIRINKCIINIDIVVNKQNYIYLDDMIKFFSKFGIFEFDLLNVIPFGNAFINKEKILCEYNEIIPYYKKAFEYSKKPHYYIWTNRLPAYYMEGFEDLIQDPHKLFDEITGKKNDFINYYDAKKIKCRDIKRCNYCNLNMFCKNFTDTVDMICKNKKIKKITANAINDNLINFINSLDYKITFETGFKNKNKTDKILSKINTLILKIDEYNIINEENFLKVNTVYKLESINSNFFNKISNNNYLIELNSKNIKIILKNLDIIKCNNERINFYIQGYELLSKSVKEYEGLEEILKKLKSKIFNCPVCLNDCGVFDTDNNINFDYIDNENKINLNKFVQNFIINNYFVKSIRCNKCIKNKNCYGIHINFVKTFGFKILKEII